MSQDASTPASTAATRNADSISPSSEREPALGQGALVLPGLGELWLAWSAKGLLMLSLPGRMPGEIEAAMVDREILPPPLADVPSAYADPLRAYAEGAAVDPASLPVDLRGTAFQLKVWQALRKIPRGGVRSYAGIAADIGAPRAMRAVGAANAANPIAIVVPCHRVVGTGLGLGGYSGGLPMKRRLLTLEGVRVDAGKVIPGQLELWDRLADD
ncbi:MAG: methylated-DNA--[protein]-cysteine S-methyltransferase [Myxococcales bacterium]